MGVIGLIIGILSIIMCFFFPIVAIVLSVITLILGIFEIVRRKKNKNQLGLAICVIIIAIIAIPFSIVNTLPLTDLINNELIGKWYDSTNKIGLIINKDGTNLNPYWLSSRFTCVDNIDFVRWGLNRVGGGNVHGDLLYKSNNFSNIRGYAIRPVVTVNRSFIN